MSFLGTILHKVIQIAGVSKTERKYINFVSGATAADNPATGATDITITSTPSLGNVTSVTGTPAAGAALRATSATAAAWGQLDLADTDAVTGVLPTGNIATTLTGKTLSSPTISGTPVLSGASSSTSNNAKGTETNVNPVHVVTADATVTTLDSLTHSTNNSCLVVTWLVGAIKSGAPQAAGYSVSAVFRNAGGTVTQVGTTTVTVLGESDSAWDATCDNSGTSVRLRVTGAAATDITWSSVRTQLVVIV